MMVRRWFRDLSRFLRREWHDRDLEEEFQAHLRMEAQERAEAGESPEAAWASARRDFGNVALVKEVTRDMWGWSTLETLLQDVRYGLRTMRRSPVFAAVAVLSLGLGLGANTAIFTLLNAVLWRRLPVERPEQLVQIETIETGTGRGRGVPSALLRGLQEHGDVFAGVVASIPDGLALRFEGRTERVVGEVVTANYFSVLGVRPFLGRYFGKGSDGAGWEAVAVLSYDFFQRRLGADPAVLGKIIHLNGYPFMVVGVSPPGFFGLEVGQSPEVRLPMMLEPGMQGRIMPALNLLDPRNEAFVDPMARLRPGVTHEQAEAATDVLFQGLFAADPETSAGRYSVLRVRLLDGSRGISGVADLQWPLLIVMSVAGLVLLVACVNVGHLLLARAAARQREMAVRVAIGAGRERLVRQLLTESLLIAGSGGLLGFAFAQWGAVGLRALLLPPSDVPPLLDLRPDPRVLAFSAGLSLTTAILFGLAPALQASRPDLTAALKPDTAALGGSGRRRLGHALVVAEVALALVLVAGAGLFLRSLRNLKLVDPDGTDRVLMFSMKPVRDGKVRYTEGQLQRLFPEILRRVETLPGVAAASVTSGKEGVAVPGVRRLARSNRTQIQKEDQTTVTVDLRMAEGVTSAFFGMFRITPLAGRTFTDADHGHAVLVISDALARDLFGSDDPIGRRIRVGRQRLSDEPWEVVGVVPSAPYDFPGSPMARLCFLPFAPERFDPISTLLVETTLTETGGLVRVVLRELQTLDKELPVFNVRTVATQIDRGRRSERLVAILSSAFGGLAVLLAAIGLYGVIAYAVARRTREIGIRVALGAERRSVVWMVLRDTLRLVFLGILVGLPLSYAAGRLVAAELHGVAPHDPAVLAASLLLMIVCAVTAAWLPARRASAVDPMVALREE
jgi:predicted permease